ncbi:MAG TPA: efflux transporter outer membrane subunit [Terriglobia bacterium]|nr:efflux transporter outer membrane subunit [Terriglobia bacterium]
MKNRSRHTRTQIEAVSVVRASQAATPKTLSFSVASAVRPFRPRIPRKLGLRATGIAIVLAALLITGCKVGPNYHRPKVQIPSAFRAPAESQLAQAQASSFADLPWWKVFQDPELQKLVRTALKNNYDLLLAAERVNAARAQLGITRSNQFPQVSANPDFTGGKSAETIKSNIFSLAADASFQLDFFGRFRRATEAARAQLLATQDARKTVILTLVSDVASNYFRLRDLDLELQITQDTVKTQEDSVKLTKLRLKHGVATSLDVLQARQVLDTANAQIPDLERQIGQTEDAINILLGNYPQGVPRGRPLGIETPQGWRWTESLPPHLPAGLPSSLLERRPDIRAAEQNLIAANADIGVAKAAFFPQVSLLGSGGGAFGHTVFFGSSVPANTEIWSYAAGLAQPLFEGGFLRSNLRYAKAQYRQALIGYRQTIQQAFGDVSDALIGYQKYYQVLARQQESVHDLQETVRVSLMRYRGGTATYLDVLDSQRSLFGAELTLAQARNNEYQALVQLYKALGGGWQH